LFLNPSPVNVEGTIKTFTGRPVQNALVTIDDQHFYTNEEGIYSFLAFWRKTYLISPSSAGDFMNGVSTLDLILMQRHILDIKKLDNPYKWIAADVNNDGKISASDLTELRKLILGVTPSFAKNPSWRFPIKSQTLDLNNPFNFKEIIAFNTSGEYMDSDFIAVKIGDVNGNVSTNIDDPAIERRSNQHVVLSVEDKKVRAGEVVAMPIMASDFKEVMGYQFTMQLKDATFQGIESGVIDVNANNLGVLENGVVTMSFASHEAFSLEEGNVLFTLMLKADKVSSIKEMISVTSDVTAAESYHADFEVGTIRLDVRIPSTSSIKLLQNEPNPFKAETIIQFDMPHAEKVILRIYDVTGKMIMERTVLATVGRNHEVLSSESLGTTGLLYYTLESGAFTATRKMIVME
jgi:hypothetical protein